MKTTFAIFSHGLALVIALLLFIPAAFADPSGGGPAANSVAKAVHKAARVSALAEEFNRTMSAYAAEKDEASRNEMLKKAQNILAKLIEQANNVESEISILAKKKLDKVYTRKLDRVLSNVLQMKAAADKRMKSTGQAG